MKYEKKPHADRKLQISQAALELIADHGLEGVSVGRIARQVGLVPSALYRHFKNKDEIIMAANGLLQSKIQNHLNAALQQHNNPLDQLELFMMGIIRIIREVRALPRIVFAPDRTPEAARHKSLALQNLTDYLTQVATIIENGRKQKLITISTDSMTLATMLWGTILPGAILWNLTNGDFDVTRYAHKAWKTFRHTLIQKSFKGEV